jgi:redox-sensitive bicupin YhaK (pirin superfamily)
MDVEFYLRGVWTRDEAGVKLYRVFSDPAVAKLTDPFMHLDHFGSRYPHEYLAGFPWHPHRRIQTVTYPLKGEVEHANSESNRGVSGPGDLQWINAGSGITLRCPGPSAATPRSRASSCGSTYLGRRRCRTFSTRT